MSNDLDEVVIPPFDPETEISLPVQVCDTIFPVDADRSTLWYVLGTPTDDQGPEPIQALIDGLGENPPLAPELIAPPENEDVYRYALRRLAAMAENNAAEASMRSELYWTYRMGKYAGCTTGQIKQDCAASLALWRTLHPRNSI